MLYDMVFEGGGAKGMVFVGALAELEARGYFPARLIGTSAGSIMATLLAAGYTVKELAAALSEKQDDQPVFLGFLETQEALTKDEIANSTIRELLREVNLRFVPDQVEGLLDDAIANALASSQVTSRIFSFIERGGFYSAQNFLSWLRGKLDAGVYPLERGARKQGEPRAFGDMNWRNSIRQRVSICLWWLRIQPAPSCSSSIIGQLLNARLCGPSGCL